MSLTRRIFLRTSAGASAALATVSAPIIAEAAQSEDPRIIEIGQALPALIGEYDAATAQVEQARILFEATKPALPPELVVKGHVGAGLAEPEHDFEYKLVWPEDKAGASRRIYSADAIFRFHGRDFGRKDPLSKRMTRLYDMATRYENAWAEAHEQSGLPEALERRDYAIVPLRRAAADIAGIQPHSLTGLVIKARTIEALARCGAEERVWVMHNYGRNCAGDILSVFRSEVPA